MRVSDSKGPRLWTIKIYWQCKPCVLIGLDYFTITFKYWCTNDVKSQRKLKYKTFNRLHLSVQVCSNNAWRTSKCAHNISHTICLPLLVYFCVVVLMSFVLYQSKCVHTDKWNSSIFCYTEHGVSNTACNDKLPKDSKSLILQ